jgi:hypothetical protein
MYRNRRKAVSFRRITTAFLGIITTIATIGYIASVAPSAKAATGDTSIAHASVLGGTNVLGIDLSQLLFPVQAGYPSDTASATTPVTSGIDLGVAVPDISLGAVSLPLVSTGSSGNALINLGTFTGSAQTSDGTATSQATAKSDVTGVKVDLTPLLGDTSVASLNLQNVISDLGLNVGAIDSTATALPATAPQGSYNIAGATLDFVSPTVAGIGNTITGDIGPLITSLQGKLVSGVNDTLATVLLPATETGLATAPTVVVDIPWQTAVDTVLATDVVNHGVTLNVANGTISIDLAQLMTSGSLNDQDPNTQVLTPAVIQNIIQGLTDDVNEIVNNVIGAVTTAIDDTKLTVSESVSVPGVPAGIAPDLLDLSVSLDATIGQILGTDTTPLDSAANAITASAAGVPLLNINAAGLLTDLQPVVTPLVSGPAGIIPALTTALQNDVTTPVLNALTPVFQALNRILQITLNAQNPSPSVAGQTFTESALSLDLLPNSALNLVGVGLTQATVMAPATVTPTTVPEPPVITSPTDAPATAPLATAPTAISGTGEVGDTVTVSVNGNVVGTTTVTADPTTGAGVWTLDNVSASAFTADGTTSNTITATQSNVIGASADSNAVGVVISAPTPATVPDPAWILPTDGTSVQDALTYPMFGGSGEPGDVIVVTYPDQSKSGVVAVGSDPTDTTNYGHWTVSVQGIANDGTPQTVYVTQYANETDAAAGTNGSNAVPVLLTVPTAAPVISSPADTSVVSTEPTAITGTGVAGSTVAVTINGTPLTTADPIVVDSTGKWSVDVPAGTFIDGQANTITATQDSAVDGYTVSDPATSTFTYDSAAIPTPVVTPDPVITSPLDGAALTTEPATITGTGVIGDTVTVTFPNGDTATAIVAADTTTGDPVWSVTVPDGAFVADGTTVNTITAVQSDPNDPTSIDSATVTSDVTVALPAAPAITSPTDGQATAPTSVTGTGVPGDYVVVTWPDGSKSDPIPVGTDGSWTVAVPPTVTFPADGTAQTITAMQYTSQADAAAGTNPSTATTVTVTVPVPVPDAPTITSPTATDALTTTDPTTVTGTGTIGDVVAVVVNGTVEGTAVVVDDGNGNGVWSFTAPAGTLVDGSNTIDAIQYPTAADVTAGTNGSTPAEVVVTATTPAAVTPDPVITSPLNGTALTTEPATITGTGVIGDSITVTLPDGTILTTTVAADPTTGDPVWSVTVPDGTFIADGTTVNTITAVQTDATTGVNSAEVTSAVTVDVPTAPAITSPTAGDQTAMPTAVTGTGVPGDYVVVTWPDGTTKSDPIPVDADGNWTVTVPAGAIPADGTPQDITATQYTSLNDATAGTNGSTPTTVTVTVPAPTTAPVAPVITGPVSADATAPLAAEPTAITGTGEAGAAVVVTINGIPLTTVDPIVVDATGKWSVDVPAGTFIADGTTVNTITATQANTIGESPVSTEVDVVIAAPVVIPDAPAITSPANGDALTAEPTEIAGTGVPGDYVVVTYPDGSKSDPILVGTDDIWTAPVTAGSFTDGTTNTITATQYPTAADATAGTNGSTPTTVTVTLDTTPAVPAAPEITSPTAGDQTTAPTEIAGTGVPGDYVVVTYPDGSKSDPILVDTDGNWIATVPPTVTFPADGTPQDITANQYASLDDATTGTNPSPDTTVTITVPAPVVIPDAPAITSPAADSTVTTEPTEITGTGTPGDVVVVTYPDGSKSDPIVVDTDGNWTAPVTPGSFTDGTTNTITATQYPTAADATADTNGSTPTTVTVTLDTTPTTTTVPAPTITDPTPQDITGTGVIGDYVVVTFPDGTLSDPVAVIDDGNGNGIWSVAYPDGSYTTDGSSNTVSVVQYASEADALAGTNPSESVSTEFTAGNLAPATYIPPTVTSPANGSTSATAPTTITGTGVPGATITVTLPDGSTVTTTVDAAGNWTVDVPAGTFKDGANTFSVVQGDNDPETTDSQPTVVTFAVGSTTPDPVVTSPTDGGSTTTEPTEVAGTGIPGDTITVTLPNGDTVTTTVADDSTWSVDVPAGSFADGLNALSVVQSDSDSSTADSAPVEVAFTLSAGAALASTGVDVTAIVAAAILTLALGLGMVILKRARTVK